MNFFQQLTGFPETNGNGVRAQLSVDGTTMTSAANGASYTIGTLTTPKLEDLRETEAELPGTLRVREVVADVQALHQDPANAGALFQVASQFNLLEMPGTNVTPADGVSGYHGDATQGPACAIACGAGTIYRNWLAPVGDHVGQDNKQIDCIADLGEAFGGGHLWDMRNGYCLATADGLAHISNTLMDLAGYERDELIGHLRIGVHANTEVTPLRLRDTRRSLRVTLVIASTARQD